MTRHIHEDTQINLSFQQEAGCSVFISAESQGLLKTSVCSKEQLLIEILVTVNQKIEIWEHY